jgi:hypothetical protein
MAGRTIMAKRKHPVVRRTRAKESDSLRKIYAILREEFTAADLQRYTVDEPGVPLQDVIASMKKTHRATLRRKT